MEQIFSLIQPNHCHRNGRSLVPYKKLNNDIIDITNRACNKTIHNKENNYRKHYQSNRKVLRSMVDVFCSHNLFFQSHWSASNSSLSTKSTSKTYSSSTLLMAIMATFLLIIATMSIPVIGSQQSIHLDQAGLYHGIVIGFSNNFQSFEPQYINTTIVSIMNQLQQTSTILKHLIGVQIADVTIILPDDWYIQPNDLRRLHYNVHESNQYRSIYDADILFTNDDKSQILTMQFGECGEGSLPINFPMLYVSDEYSAKLLAHQWLLYRYGVFNEFGLEDDFNYPVYFKSPGLINGENGKSNSVAPKKSFLNASKPPHVNSCYQGSNVHFKYSSNCNNATDINTGRPINPNCDVIPTIGSIDSSFMYAPIAVSEYRLCNASTHDYQSPTKHNIMCDYQSIQEVIAKHADFERLKPIFNGPKVNSSALFPIRFNIVQNRRKDDISHAHVLYALPQHNCRFLQGSLSAIVKIPFFQHQAMFALYGQQFKVVSGWIFTSQLSMIFMDNTDLQFEKIPLRQIFQDIVKQFKTDAGGTCVFYFSGETQIDDYSIDNIEYIAEMLNKKNIQLKVIIYDEIASNEVLNFFDQLSGKVNMHSSVDYVFGPKDSSASSLAFRTQLSSIITSTMFDLLQKITEHTHILIKSETVRSPDPTGIEFTIDPTINQSYLFIDMSTNGKAIDFALDFNLTDNHRKVVKFMKFEMYEKNLHIFYGPIKTGSYNFNFKPTVSGTYITTSIRAFSTQSIFNSYKDANLSARCWIQPSDKYPLRGFVQVSQGLNGPIYDADVTLIARIFNRAQQKNEITFPLNDNGRGNPDITARDGIYSAYLNSIFADYSESSAAYTISARILSNRISIKPGNFGNTVMFASKPRCCGSELKTNADIILNHRFERIVHCGSFYYSPMHHKRPKNSYAIRDLRIVNLDQDNRTVSLEWSSPFYSMDPNKPIIIKAFHSYTEHNRLPLNIKEGFDINEQNEVQIEIISRDDTAYTTLPNADDLITNMGGSSLNDDLILEESIQTYTLPNSKLLHNQQPQIFQSFSPTTIKSPLTKSLSQITNSLRQMSIRILSDEEGYYLIAVKERNDENESKPSNIITVYLKSNVLVENITAFANDSNRLSAGTYRDYAKQMTLSWIHILIICIACALLIFILILIIICITIRGYRHNEKQTDADFNSDGQLGKRNVGSGHILNDKTEPKAFFLNQQTDENSLISNEKMAPNSNASNHTSCSSVNTVDNLANHNPYGLSNGHLEEQVGSDFIMEQNNNSHKLPGPMLSVDSIDTKMNSSIMKELNVATLSPNSWDAKDLLDHWGRVQEAKMRLSSPSIRHQAHNNYQTHHNLPQQTQIQQQPRQSNSPSVLSYGGSSSLDNYNHNNGSNSNSYLCQPAIVNSGHYDLATSTQPFDQQPYFNAPQILQQPHLSEYQSSIYSPYSNASSIWRHHQKQQQQQQHQSYLLQPNSHLTIQTGSKATAPNSVSVMTNFPDNGLPECNNLIRKISPNISQV